MSVGTIQRGEKTTDEGRRGQVLHIRDDEDKRTKLEESSGSTEKRAISHVRHQGTTTITNDDDDGRGSAEWGKGHTAVRDANTLRERKREKSRHSRRRRTS